jgi:hypothetical protein
MTAETTAATGTADTSPVAAPTPDAATQATTPTGSEATPQATDTPPTAPAVPETYSFDMPEGVTLDQAAVDKFTPLFKKANLSQEHVSEIVAAYTEHLSTLSNEDAFTAAYTERRQAEIASRIEADAKALKADPEIGGSHFAAVNKQVTDFIGAHGTPEFRAFIDEHGIGNNPEFVRVLSRAIAYTPIDTGEQPAGGGGADPAADQRARWYPDLAKK